MNLTKLFKSISDEIRLRILRLLLKGSFNVNEILYIIGGRQSNISHHLKILLDNDIAINKKEGSQIYYKLVDCKNNETLKNIIKVIERNINSIPFYQEDLQRLEVIYQRRKKIAEEYFNQLNEEASQSHYELLNNIYSVNDFINYFTPGCDSIIDIGCGTGRNIPLLSQYTNKIIGIDSSPRMLQLAEHICKELNVNYELKLTDTNSTPFNSDSISGAFINMVLHHIPDPGSAINEVGRILCKNGKLLLIEFLEHNDESMREKYADLWLGFSQIQLTEWLKDSGFIIEEAVTKKESQLPAIIIMAKKI